ncbi:uncharacterized protein VTP21DRAFT_6710 [Calcarisporiella thermophila]|uniref:uncharacterized protein n=1 Tax=Calcarisporiella thermophila TaxID=911321 RepID=UPI0037437FA7
MTTTNISKRIQKDRPDRGLAPINYLEMGEEEEDFRDDEEEWDQHQNQQQQQSHRKRTAKPATALTPSRALTVAASRATPPASRHRRVPDEEWRRGEEELEEEGDWRASGWDDEEAREPESKRDRKRREVTERLSKMEQEFLENREIIYRDNIQAFQNEMRELEDGTHPEFLERLADLQASQNAMVQKAKLFRDYQVACARKQYETETTRAEEEYTMERQGLRERMLAAIEERRRKLKEDKDNIDISNDMSIETHASLHQKRNLRKRGLETNEPKTSKRRPFQGPNNSHTLKDDERIDDVAMIRKGAGAMRRVAVKSDKMRA